MPTPPRRKRFQIHLSTAVVMMFVAGGIIALNLVRAPGDKNVPTHRVSYDGWPLKAYTLIPHIINDGIGPGINRLRIVLTREWVVIAIVGNAVIACCILLAVWFLCEWLIRRAARKGQ